MSSPAVPESLGLIEDTYGLPLLELVQRAARVHAQHWRADDMEKCTLLSIKTGQCSENCSYCAQSSHHGAPVEPQPLLTPEEIVDFAKRARNSGSTRFCMSAAGRGPADAAEFSRIVKAVREVRALGIETCASLGTLTEEQAAELKDAGLDYYNHNIDTSPEYYATVVTTRTFEDRIENIGRIRRAGIHLCCGGIVGMGESHADRVKMLAVLVNMDPPPDAVPINMLVRIPGTPLENVPELDPFDAVRMIAVARIVLPKARIRLSAGRKNLSREAQALCFVAGANSIFVGDKLLTTPLPGDDFDASLLRALLEPVKIV